MPPSADDLPGRMPLEQAKKADGKRRPGKQPGAAGSYLAWNDNPDDTISHVPQGACGCGRDLA